MVGKPPFYGEKEEDTLGIIMAEEEIEDVCSVVDCKESQ
jgi:hypothetical protein